VLCGETDGTFWQKTRLSSPCKQDHEKPVFGCQFSVLGLQERPQRLGFDLAA
jgi:hypothetical protein